MTTIIEARPGKPKDHPDELHALGLLQWANGAVAMKLAIVGQLQERGLIDLANQILMTPVPPPAGERSSQ